MSNFASAAQSDRWAALVAAAKRGVKAQGYTMTRQPGRGLSNIWKLEKDGKTQLAAIRTTQDRWFAFPPLQCGTKWKTLDDVELIVLAAVDSPEHPRAAEVYVFPQSDVRERFTSAYKARVKAGLVQRDNFGMWVNLDSDNRAIAASVGSGIVEEYKPVGVYSLDELLKDCVDGSDTQIERQSEAGPARDEEPATIAEVLTWARHRVAEIAGVGVDAVRLELKLET